MIRIVAGLMGSGKSATEVRNLFHNPQQRTTYTNIILKKKLPNVVQITRDMIIKKELLRVDRNGKEIFKYSLNAEFWKEQAKGSGINILLDEAHTILDSRRSMSKINKIMNDFMALIRRILGSSDGELILISQISEKLDINCRRLATSVSWSKFHYLKSCNKCNATIRENNEYEPKLKNCPRCNGFKFTKHNFYVEKWEFRNMEDLNCWRDMGLKTYYQHYYITDISTIFPLYSTYQWENLISDYEDDD